jgi:nucleoside-diphosphate-sugar epimerase
MKEDGMKVLVTGATGFTGGHLARELQRRGRQVRALVRDPSKADALAKAGIELAPGDLVDAAAVKRAAEGCDVIYHIAAVYREARHGDDFYRRVNVGGTVNVLDAARDGGVGRVVHCSTVGVHGDITSVPADENAPMSPGDVYQDTKLEAENIASQRFATLQGGTIFRPVGIYGPGDLRFLKLFKTIYNGSFRMIGSGDVLYHMTYIDDLVDGIIRCGEEAAAAGQVYILSGPRYTTVRELVASVAKAEGRQVPRGRIPLGPMMAAATLCEWLCKPLGIEPPLHRRRLDFFIKDRGFTSDKARREIGYQPRVDLEEGLARTFAWYRSAGLL